MKRNVLAALAASATVLTALVVGSSPSTAQAPAAAHPARADAKALARATARRLVRSQAPQLEVGPHDGFTPGRVWSSGRLQYVSYERTYRGLPVLGGDFVVVTDARGQVLHTSVAQKRPTRLASLTPARRSGPAARIAVPGSTGSSSSSRPRLVVWQGGRSHLAWSPTWPARSTAGRRGSRWSWTPAAGRSWTPWSGS